MIPDPLEYLKDYAEKVDKMPLHQLMALIRQSSKDRRKTRRGATHTVNPPGSKIARKAKAYLLTKR